MLNDVSREHFGSKSAILLEKSKDETRKMAANMAHTMSGASVPLGLIVEIDLVFGGYSLAMMALAARG
jgi:hypothetical protein